jgi:hypothetical protein
VQRRADDRVMRIAATAIDDRVSAATAQTSDARFDAGFDGVSAVLERLPPRADPTAARSDR